MEVIRMTQQVLQAINEGDAETYMKMVDPDMTSFEPEAIGNMVTDTACFHRFYLDLTAKREFPKRSIILHPTVYLLGENAACIAYVRLTQFIDTRTGQACSKQAEETRLWLRKNGVWLNVHTHRSNNTQPSTSHCD
ncbi:calcium/calmodulin-dependent protein kinase type II alpha chain-like [Tropilaelaps mercedesae]|uniref:Calcium/calmodulin-dependent protein kinase type II alpha chain-like n=1 Tax=Tropilaelaps mercedesae TaxID=418985 RepID=A0A1V9XUB2_9ACAR|nr:calcium/calmodulin-dependent protein kinase type II alpha chain-like [Tropilaelaps mercedesae]